MTSATLAQGVGGDAPDPSAAKLRRGPGRIAGIDGLRAIALTLVVLFHLFGRGRVSGGVDVFLFVSGVVLAISLTAAVDSGRSIGFVQRWGRTFSRLAPPAAVVLLAVVVMSFTILPPWSREQNLMEVGSAALYLENWQLIASQLAYGAAGPATSPVQHFWSLSIQGQLLIAIPVVTAGVFALGRVVRRPGLVVWALGVVATIASFVYAIALQRVDQDAAYFDTFARFWELGLGLLIGGAIARGLALRGASGAALGWAGLVVILLSGWIVDGAAAYPGPAALLPVLGAAAVVLSLGGARFGPRLVLDSRFLAGLTKISYSLYLWHWPVLIAFLAVTARADGVVGLWGAIFVLAVSVGLAVLTWCGLERPLARRLSASPSNARLLTAGIAVGVVVCVTLAGLVSVQVRLSGAAAGQVACQVSSPSVADADRTGCTSALEDPTCLGAAALDPLRPECADAADPDVPPVPAYESLSRDDDNKAACWATIETPLAMCSLGPASGYTRHLLAVGDSHNNALIGVYEEIALSHGWRIDVAGRGGCHWTHATRKQKNEVNVQNCADWIHFVDEYASKTDLDGIIVTNSSRASYRAQAGRSLDEVRADGYADAWARRKNPDIPIFAIRDNPIFPLASISCVLDLARVKAGECAIPRDDAFREDGLRDAVALDENAHLIDVSDYICEPTRCPLVVGGVIVSRDGLHFTATFARTLAPYIERPLVAILGE